MSWNQSDMHLTAWDVRRGSFESLLQEWRLRVALAYSSLADETGIRRNINVLGRECFEPSSAAISERKVSQHACVLFRSWSFSRPLV